MNKKEKAEAKLELQRLIVKRTKAMRKSGDPAYEYETCRLLLFAGLISDVITREEYDGGMEYCRRQYEEVLGVPVPKDEREGLEE